MFSEGVTETTRREATVVFTVVAVVAAVPNVTVEEFVVVVVPQP